MSGREARDFLGLLVFVGLCYGVSRFVGCGRPDDPCAGVSEDCRAELAPDCRPVADACLSVFAAPTIAERNACYAAEQECERQSP